VEFTRSLLDTLESLQGQKVGLTSCTDVRNKIKSRQVSGERYDGCVSRVSLASKERDGKNFYIAGQQLVLECSAGETRKRGCAHSL